MTVGELAREVRVNLATIRYYEKRGLLPRPERLASGYRCYTEEALRRIRFIKRAQVLGFTLREIEALLAWRATPGVTCADIRLQAEEKIANLERKIQSLTAIKKALVSVTATCDGNSPVAECNIVASLEDGDLWDAPFAEAGG